LNSTKGEDAIMSLRIASYNIHGWVDADMESNLERVAEVVNLQDPDILCLQEVYACWDMPCLLEFLRKTLFEHILRWEGCAILSKKKYVLEEWGAKEAVRAGGNYHRLLEKAPGFEFNRPRYLTAKVKTEDNPEETLFYLTCIHLVPKYSDLRQEEILRISDDLSPLFDKNAPQFWCGDFNTLSRGDYTDYEWEEIVRIRRVNGRKAPLNNVIDTIRSLGFSDNWVLAGRPEPRTTSRFDTRVDYMFSSETFNKNWSLVHYGHFPYDASDHSFVVADFSRH